MQAGQDFKKGDIICCFGGELIVKEKHTYRAATYNLVNHCDQSCFSGKGIFINDGPPNCIFTYIKKYKGISQYAVVKAVRDIRKGELLHTYYGNDHGIKSGKYFISEKSYQEVWAYCKTGRFYQPQELIDEEIDCYFEQMFNYIFGVFSLFVNLHLYEILDVERTKRLMNNPIVQEIFKIHEFPTYYLIYPEILDIIDKILQIKQTDPMIVHSVVSLSEDLSEAAYVQMLLLMQKDPHLVFNSIIHYRTLGKLYDHLYIVLNGTLNGTYLGKEQESSEEKMINFHPNIPMIEIRYASLPADLKKAFITHLKEYIEETEQEGLIAKSQEFAGILNDLLEEFSE